jgi:hypothetical protein
MCVKVNNVNRRHTESGLVYHFNNVIMTCLNW